MANERPAADVAGANLGLSVLLLSTGVWTAQALWVTATLGVADHLAAGPRTREELAAAIGVLPGPLYRVIRALACLDVFAEQPDGRIANTPQSEMLRSDVPGSLRDYVVMLGQPWHVAAFGELLHAVRTGRPSVERVVGKSLWEFFAADPEASRIFNASMTGIVADSATAARDGYDFTGIETLVDVGGCHGMLLGTVLAANPSLRGVLFDLPHVVAGAVPTLHRLGVTARTTIVGGDFFREVPRGDAYILSHIIHDWDDERSAAILQTIRRAAAPRARLLLVETVVPPGNDFSFAKLLDLEMLALPGGLERTEAEYAALFRAGGFRLTRVITARSYTNLIEGMAEPA
jgi:hypothetical protein